MAEGSIGTRREQVQSKLQEYTETHSGSVLSEGAEYRLTPPLIGRNTDSPTPYIVGDTSPPHSQPIPFHHVENIIQAAGYARLMGLPLYHHLTIRWPTGNWQCHEGIIRAIAEWQRYHIGCPAFVWAKEANGGPHSHILLHVPKEKSRKFRAMIVKTLKRLSGLKSLPPKTIQNRRVWSHGSSFQHMRNRVAYILKRADEDTRCLLRVGKRDFGKIDGKLTGVSQSLGEAARRKAKSVLPSGHRRCPPFAIRRDN